MGDSNPITNEHLERGVCSITINNARGTSRGTGFHYGNGWVMSNTHVFQSNASVNGVADNLVDEATFTFNANGNVYKFQPHKRMAFIHHLIPGRNANIQRDVDIAMVKLGTQYAYCGRQPDQWERNEDQQLMNFPTFADFDSLAVEVQPESIVEALYPVYNPTGGNQFNIVTTKCKISNIQANAQGPTVLTLRSAGNTDNNSWPLAPGTSGCPIVIKQDGGRRVLVGIHFSGDTTSSCALQLSNGRARDCLNGGVEIFSDVDAYLGWKALGETGEVLANEAKENFNQSAQELQLSIYIYNGERHPYTLPD